MRKWQFDVLFAIAAAGVVFLPFAHSLGIQVDAAALPGFGAILTYVLTQRTQWTAKEEPQTPAKTPPPVHDDDDDKVGAG